MTATAPKYRLRVRGTWLHVRYSQPAERSAGGIWLPDVARENVTQAQVLAAGDGRLPGGGRCAMQGEPGVVVLAPKHAYTPITRDEAQVHDEDLLATIYTGEDGEPVLVPANAYVLVERERAEVVTDSGLVLPETVRRRANRGVILDYGPGEVRTKGPLAGVRRTVYETFNVPLVEELAGRECAWSDRAAAVQVTSAGSACWLLPAGAIDLLDCD